MILTEKNRYPFWLLAALLGAVVFLLYSVSLGHNFFFDEENIILNNPTIRSLRSIPDIFKSGYFYFHARPVAHWDEYYRPLTSITYAIDHFFWGFDPLGYNLTNLFLHLALCVLYFRLLTVLLDHRIAAFLAALLYGAHTIHTEVVTYTASRGDLLGVVFMLSAMLFYLRGRRVGALGCYFLALFSKESMILLPFYLLALDIGFVKSPLKALLRKIAPFFLIAALFWLYRRFWCPIPLTPAPTDLGAALLRVLGMGDAMLRYLRALVAPEYFRLFADVPVLYGFNDPLIWTAVTVASLLLAAWFLSWRRRDLFFTGMTILLVALAPHLQLVEVYPKWAEHYICIASLGLFLLLGLGIRFILQSQKKRLTIFFLILYLPFLFFICLRTWQRNQMYNDPERFHTLLSQSDTPYRFYGYQQLARSALDRGDASLAGVYLRAALSLEFRSEFTHELMGQYFLKKGHPTQALHEFKLAYYYSSANPRQLQFIGTTLIELGRYREARDIYLLMHRLDPASAGPYVQMMAVHELLREPEKTLEWAHRGAQAFESQPKAMASVTMALARFYYRQNRPDLSLRKMTELVEKYPQVDATADLARFCTGKMTTRRFLKQVDEKYPYYQDAAPALVLMAHVLLKQKGEALLDLKKNHEKLKKLARKNPLIRRELGVAQKFLMSQ